MLYKAFNGDTLSKIKISKATRRLRNAKNTPKMNYAPFTLTDELSQRFNTQRLSFDNKIHY